MLNWIIWNKTVLTLTLCIAQSAGAVEYTDCSLLPSLLWLGMVVLDRALSMGWRELTAYLCLTELFELELFDKTE